MRGGRAAFLLAVELAFDRPLALGETQPFRHRITDDTGGECTECTHDFRPPVGHCLLQVYFTPPTLPVPLLPRDPDPLNGYCSAHLTEQDAGPGIGGHRGPGLGTGLTS
ncbi:hypothetical protein [Streptomyces tendae]|uniref:hypothetical protein n=1 Tax=Streptomyces tendae TaxID=1932 RepID=UPI0036F865C3